ncbi:MAG: hypothetical protein NTY19_35695 [Planctomycetota bacterium]|nr:hypothetical protein [Planctomycetota bacterium]
MNVDHILDTMNRTEVAYLLFGGVNFLLRHAPVLTFDIDLWIEDGEQNRRRCELALGELAAEWGVADDDWGSVAQKGPGWLDRQGVFCLNSPHGAIDIFRSVKGLDDWNTSRSQARDESTAAGTRYLGLSDTDMLRCQYALDEPQQKQQRIRVLEAAIGKPSGTS